MQAKAQDTLDHFAFDTISSPQTAGVSFIVTITAQDSSNNNVTSYDGTPTLSDTSGTISPTITSAFAGGVWTGSVTVTKAGSDVITATDVSLDASGTSGSFTVTHGSAVSIAVTPASDSITAGSTETYTAMATDAYGNTWDVTGSVTWSITSGAGGSWVQSTGTYTSAKTGSWTVKALSGSVFGTASLTVTGHGSVSSIAVSPSSPSIAAGNSQAFTATASDGLGNSWDVTGSVTWSITSGAGGSWVQSTGTYTSAKTGSWTVKALSGSVFGTASLTVTGHGSVSSIAVSPSSPSIAAGNSQAFTATASDGLGNSWDVTGSVTWSITSGAGGSWVQSTGTYTSAKTGSWTVKADDGAGHTDTASLTVNHAATISSIAVSPSSATVTAGASQDYTATAYDSHGNSWDVTDSVTWSISSGAGGSWSSNVYTSHTAGPSWTVTASYSGKQATATLTVNAAGAASFVVSGFPSPTVAGAAHSVTVTAKDVYGNTVTGYAGTVAITSSDSQAVLPANAGLTRGIGSFTVILKTAGSQSITATDTATILITGSQTGITVNVASGFYFVVSGFPSSTVAGVAHSVTVIAYDAYGNVATGYAGTVAITSSDSQAVLPANAGLTRGIGSFTVILKTAGSQSITATDTVTSSITGLQNGITVTAAGLDHIVISPTSLSIVAGNSQAFTAEAFDQYGNSRGGVTSSATFTAPGASVTGNSVYATAVGSYTVTATYNGKSDSTTLMVNAGALDHFVFNTVGAQTAGSAFNITVTAKDASGNTVTSYTGTPSLTYSAGSISPITMNTFISGVGSTSVTVTTAGSDVNITATDGSSTGTSNSFTVTIAPTPTPTSTSNPTPIPTPKPTPTPTPTPSPTSTPSATNVTATTGSGATVDLAISGNVTSSQISNATITSYQPTKTTIVSFTITGLNGTAGFSNMTIPKTAISYGTSPVVYIDGQQAPKQGYTRDANNFYVWYTISFSAHQVSIQFVVPSTSLASSLGPVLAVGIAVAEIISIFTVIAVKRLRRKPDNA